MDIILVFTFVAVFLSIYQIIPEYKKSRFSYALSWNKKALICFLSGTLLSLYLYFSFFQYHNPNQIIKIFGINLNFLFVIDLISTSILISLFLYLLHFAFKKNINIESKDNFFNKIEEYINKKDYFSSIQLIKIHFQEIYSSEDEDLKYKIKRIILKKEFLENLSKIEPYFCIRIIRGHVDTDFKKQFLDDYLKILLEDNKSILYDEIKNNQNLHGVGGRYELIKENKLITSLLKNAKIAEELEIWRPLGEFVLEQLNEQRTLINDKYNYFDENFNDYSEYSTLYSDKIFVSLRFFDIMLLESLHQKINWHMWLYYYYYLTQYICKNYKITEFSSPKEENPNSYSRLLNELVSNLIKWIRESDQNIKGYSPKAIDAQHDNGDIIKSSIICLFQCHQEIIDSKEIPNEFKRKITHFIYDLYFELSLSKNPDSNKYAEVLLLCLEDKIKGYSKRNESYKLFLIDSLNSFDQVPVAFKGGADKLKEFEKRIKKC